VSKIRLNILDLLTLQVSKYPNECAIVDNNCEYSYLTLWQMSERVSHSLITQKLPRNSIIGLNFEKSADYIAAIIGIWKAGCAFAPLSKKYPEARVKECCQLANIVSILSQIPEAIEPESIDLELRGAENGSSLSNDAFDRFEIKASDLAYVYFTSGSTGKPKAVAVEHRGILPLVESQIVAFDLKVNKRALFYLDISFDASLSDILTCLGSGATLVMEPQIDDMTSLEHALNTQQITTFDIPPSLLPLLNPENIPDSLDTLIVGGEPSKPETLCQWAKKLNVISVYGPTETTICSSMQLVDAVAWDRPFIGQPIKGTNFSVRDDKGVITGSAGELWISGLGVARGYLGQSTLTEEKFVVDSSDGTRWYRTGDKVIYQQGNYEFLGRIDRQLKVRGQLISPEEIEACLLTPSFVKHAAVSLEKSYLVAYVVGEKSDLKPHLQKQLPVWMQPVKIYWVDRLPRLDSGKVNFTELPQIIKPDTPVDITIEDVLISLFSDILELETVGLDDDFFELGGDSIAVMSLLVAIEAFGYRLTSEDIYEYSTVKLLSHRTKSMLEGKKCKDLVKDTYWRAPPHFIDKSFKETPEALMKNSAKVENILITGATGFLGSQIVVELLEQTTANLYCIVRADSNMESSVRLQQIFKARKLPYNDSRIHVYAGDIAKENLGLDHVLYNNLNDSIDSVIHCAAEVNVLLSYASLFDTNVLGTKHILDFIVTGHSKKLLYASTLSVFVGAEPLPDICYETDSLKETRTVYGGYAQTKWVSEVMVRNSQNNISHLCIARLGLLTGDERTAQIPENDLFYFFIRTISRAKCIPEGIRHLTMDLTPVDYAAKVMLMCFLDSARIHETDTVHIANPMQTTGQMLIDAFSELDEKITVINNELWLDKVSSLTDCHEKTATILGLSRILNAQQKTNRMKSIDLFAASNTRFDLTQLDQKVNRENTPCPIMTSEKLKQYILTTLETSCSKDNMT